MIDKVKALLNKHSYMLKLNYDSKEMCISLHIPARVQMPSTDAYDIKYYIINNQINCYIDKELTEIECPNYAIRTLILVDVRKVCEYLGFDHSLLEFYCDGDKIVESDFFDKIWPSNLEYTEDIRKQEYALKELVTRSINAIIPFHASFDFEAAKLGVSIGYTLIRAFVIGEN